MQTKVELKEFFNLRECRDFVNRFSKNKEVVNKRITPIVDNDVMRYFVFLEYCEKISGKNKPALNS